MTDVLARRVCRAVKLKASERQDCVAFVTSRARWD